MPIWVLVRLCCAIRGAVICHRTTTSTENMSQATGNTIPDALVGIGYVSWQELPTVGPHNGGGGGGGGGGHRGDDDARRT